MTAFAGVNNMQREMAEGVQQMLSSAGADDSFAHYVMEVIASKSFEMFWVLLFFGALGVIGNYFWKWATNQIKGSLWKYLFIDYPKRTIVSFMAICGWAFTAAITLDIGTAWGIIINLALTTGFTVDILVNKASRSQWTEEQRAARAARGNVN